MINIKYLLVCIFLFSNITFAFSQGNLKHDSSKINSGNQEYFSWDVDRKLTPNDFIGTIQQYNSSEVASTASGFGFIINDDNGFYSGSIHVRFYPDKSWWDSNCIDSKTEKYVLKHEQVHFDICELFGRKLYSGILQLRDSKKLNERNLRKLYKKLEKEYSQYQKTYDKATKHSVNRVEQHYWNKQVAEELEKMSEYAGYSSF